MEEKKIKENIMGTMPIRPLLVKQSMPIVISMLVQALYNVVDSIFVSSYSEEGLAALSFSFPIQNLIIAVGVGTAVGVNSLLSRKLGERRYEEANLAAENGIFLAILSWLAFAVFGLFFCRGFFELFNPTPTALEMGVDYLSICTIFSVGCFVQMTSERILQATGKAFYSMISQGVGAITNIILDPLFIFGFGPIPSFGVKGAAIATVIGQMFAMCLALFFNKRYNTDVHMRFRSFRPSLRSIKDIYAVGLPSILMQSIATIMTMGMNIILMAFNQVAVSVFGIYFKLQSFIFMPVFGFTNGLVPIVGYNYGAGQKRRIVEAVRDCLIYCVSIMFVGVVVFVFFPAQLLALFQASDELIGIGIPALRTISLSFLGAGAGIVFSAVFQAVGNGKLSLIMSGCRQLVLILPVAWLLSNISLDAVWYAFAIAEVMSLIMGIFMYRHVYKSQIDVLVPIDERDKGIDKTQSVPE